MDNVLDFLSSLRSSYHLYIGDEDLQSLKHFIDGYNTCLINLKQMREAALLEQFVAFVTERYNDDLTDESIFTKIQRRSTTMKNAFETFFNLLDEFKSLKNP